MTGSQYGERAEGRLTTIQLGRLLRSLPAADAVELKVAVPDPDRSSVIHALGVDPLTATIRQVVFVDDMQLRLLEAGIVVRARRTQARRSDIVVKLRPLPLDAVADVRHIPGTRIEIDLSPQGFTLSCALKSKVGDRRIRDLMSGRCSMSGVLTAAQLELLGTRCPPSVSLDDLVVFGPVHVLRRKFSPDSFSGVLCAEQWFLPDGERVLELSTRCMAQDVVRTSVETRQFLERHGVDLAAPQRAKTRTALAALVTELSAVRGR